ncbi:MAG: hypothetical protein AAF197_08665, partial [Pseudomonadota bacterium]
MRFLVFSMLIACMMLIGYVTDAQAQVRPEMVEDINIPYDGDNRVVDDLVDMTNQIMAQCLRTGSFNRRDLVSIKRLFQQAEQQRVFQK